MSETGVLKSASAVKCAVRRWFICVLGAAASALFMPAAIASTIYYEQVTIINFLAGPRHGSMMQLSNGVWLCLDPEGETMTMEKSKRMYAFLLGQYLTGGKINVTAYQFVKPAACGSAFMGVEDVRVQQ
jgi:hypothetical protein